MDFHFESAKEQLSQLDIEQLSHQSMLYTTVEDYDDGLPQGNEQDSYQGQMLRLGASINTESRLTVCVPLESTTRKKPLMSPPDRMCRRHPE